jgi:hypothetical protein
VPAPPPAPPSESLASARLWLAFAIMMLVGGIGNSFPVFFPPLLTEFGGSRAATAPSWDRSRAMSSDAGTRAAS